MKRISLFIIIFIYLILTLFFTLNSTLASNEITSNTFKIIKVKKGNSYEDKAIGIIFPFKLGDLELEHVKHFSEPGLGYSLRYFYTLPYWIKIDIYVYNKRLPSIPFGIYSKEVNAEFFSINSYMENSSYYQRVKKISVGVYPKSKSIQFLWSCYEFLQLKEPGVTYEGIKIKENYITGFRNHFIKIFSTYWKEREEAGRKLTSYFIEDLSELLRKTGEDGDIPQKSGPKRFVILKERGDWLIVYFEDGIEKWVQKPQTAKQPPEIKLKEQKSVYVKWPVVSLREGPGLNFKIISELKKGTILTVIEEQEHWFRVKVEDGLEGWIGKATVSETP